MPKFIVVLDQKEISKYTRSGIWVQNIFWLQKKYKYPDSLCVDISFDVCLYRMEQNQNIIICWKFTEQTLSDFLKLAYCKHYEIISPIEWYKAFKYAPNKQWLCISD